MLVTSADMGGSVLEHPSLILNKGWTPIDACTVREALCDVFADKAKVICPDSYEMHDINSWMELDVKEGDPFIRTVDRNIRVPEVIICTYPKVPKRKVIFSRRNLWKRDGYRCQYCGEKPHYDDLTIDHVVPRSKGGRTTFDNTVLACVDCNKKKDNRTPEQAGMRLRRMVRQKDGTFTPEFYFRPTIPKWSPVYAMRRQKFPLSWKKFIDHMIDELYWNTELDP